MRRVQKNDCRQDIQGKSTFALAEHVLNGLVRYFMLTRRSAKRLEAVPADKKAHSHIHVLPTLKVEITLPLHRIVH